MPQTHDSNLKTAYNPWFPQSNCGQC